MIWRLILFFVTCVLLSFGVVHIVKNFWENSNLPWYKDIGTMATIIGLIGFCLLIIFKTN